ncbi:ATP-binding protein [Streptomyces roseifaciens]
MTARPAGTGAPRYTESLPCVRESARRARLLVTAALYAWGLPCMIDSAILVVSELVANAVEHSGGRLMRVTVARPQAHRVRIAVVDLSADHPVPRQAGDDDVRGRGLEIVTALSDAWGTESLRWGRRQGKRVWADLRPACHTGADR